MLIIKEEKGRQDGDIFVELTRNRDLNVSDCDRLGYWCDKPHLEHFLNALASVFKHEDLEEIFSKILKRKQKFEPKDGDILFTGDRHRWVYIFKGIYDERRHHRYVSLCIDKSDIRYHDVTIITSENARPATEEEKQILFDKLKEAGKRWNPEKKRIEDIPEEPKIGDMVIAWGDYRVDAIIGTYSGYDKDQSKHTVRETCKLHKCVVKWNGTKEHLEKVRKGEI